MVKMYVSNTLANSNNNNNNENNHKHVQNH